MTDSAYISAFLSNNQKAITAFYSRYKASFVRIIGSKCRMFDSDTLVDIYQDATCRLWENIQRGKLTNETLTTTLFSYLCGIGELVAFETLRANKEILITDSILHNSQISDAEVSCYYYEKEERYQAVRETVNKMGKPCAPLLLNFYWNGYSMEEIAQRLNYKNADSAKTQKNKCMNKLKSILKNKSL
ncbi:MAG: sigma-70 family RNA polymerase sigma factor [Paludibacteraceae bacterium]|nr:sigma-70 family RNA polymerase sigma factor [Paludibacteraceae bacterium]